MAANRAIATLNWIKTELAGQPMEEILLKYRPKAWEDVIGQDAAVQALRQALDRHKAYLFSGPTGVGKTTLARILAQEIGAGEDRTIEVDAASTSGIDASRATLQLVTAPQLSDRPLCLIVDEAHGLSTASWQVLLKPIEEPPPHLWICLATTEVGKVPATIKSRCFHVPLRPVDPLTLSEYLRLIAEVEEWKIPQDAITLIVQSASGSVRLALSMLSAVAQSPGDYAAVIPGAVSADAVSTIGKGLREGKTPWGPFVEALKGVVERDEGLQTAAALSRYLLKTILGTKDPTTALKLAHKMGGLSMAVGDRTGQALAAIVTLYLEA